MYHKKNRHLCTRSGPSCGQGALQQGSTAPERNPHDSYYNRVQEQALFSRKFAQPPGKLTVLTGPPNCGKTRFLRELCSTLKTEEDATPFFYINGRLGSTRTPEQFSRAICEQITSNDFQVWLANQSPVILDRIRRNFQRISSTAAPSTATDLLAELKSIFEKDENDLDTTLKNMRAVFEALQVLVKKPVLIIDEANILMRWEKDYISQRELDKLLDFLIVISKEKDWVHVVLATTDCCFAGWLAGRRLGWSRLYVMVLGNLPENEARDFMFGDAEGTWPGIINKRPFLAKKVRDSAEEQWPEIYKWCGGNILELETCIQQARTKRDWKIALESIEEQSREAIQRGFRPSVIPKHEVAPLWTKEQWKLVLECITAAPHHAVLRSKVVTELNKQHSWWPWQKKVSGETVLLSMEQYNLLTVRPPSFLARDIPEEAYKSMYGGKEEVVTMRLPGHAAAAKDLLAEMNAEKKRKK